MWGSYQSAKGHTYLWVQLCLRTNKWTIFPRANLSEWILGKMNLQWTLKADAWVIGYLHCLTNLPHPIPTEISLYGRMRRPHSSHSRKCIF